MICEWNLKSSMSGTPSIFPSVAAFADRSLPCITRGIGLTPAQFVPGFLFHDSRLSGLVAIKNDQG